MPNRLIVRGTIGLPGKWVFSPLFEWRTGFPWSAVDEFQDFVGARNRGRAAAERVDARLHARAAVALLKYRFTAGIKIYNAFDTGNERDVQNNIASPDYGKFYNPIQRSITVTPPKLPAAAWKPCFEADRTVDVPFGQSCRVHGECLLKQFSI